jgi:phage gpG-like protein
VVEFSGKIETIELEQRIGRITADMLPEVVKLANQMIGQHQRDMTQRLSNGALKRRTGALVRSLRPSYATPERPTATTNVGRGAPYAKAHEFGMTIRPRNRQFLTVPLRNAQTAAGVTRQQAKLRRSGRGFETASLIPGAEDTRTFIFTSVGNRKLIAVPKRGGGVMPLYLLRKSVRIPERLGFRQTWANQKRWLKTNGAARLRQIMGGRR